MPEQNTGTTNAQPTPDAAANNTGADNQPGTGTQPAETPTGSNSAAQEKTFTQAEVDRIIAERVKRETKKELKKLAGENTDAPNVEELQRREQDLTARANQAEARLAIRDFVTDPSNKTGAKPTDLRSIEKLVLAEIEFGDDGKPVNLKEAVAQVKKDAPSLFAQQPPSVNAAAGGNSSSAIAQDFNQMLRAQAGYGTRTP